MILVVPDHKRIAEPFSAGLVYLDGPVSPAHLLTDATFEMVNFIVKKSIR